MKQKITIGVVCFARKTFDFTAALGIYRGIMGELERQEDVAYRFVTDLVFERDEALAAAEKLRGEGIDGLICISGTFHLGHLALELNKILGCPIMLWALSELPYNGGKIRLNSICGVNLDASNLYKSGIRNYHVTIGDKVDQDWLDALRVVKALSSARIGIAGSRAHGFFNLSIQDLDAYHKYGTLIDNYQLADIYSTTCTAGDVARRASELCAAFDVAAISPAQLDKVAELSVKFDGFMTDQKLDGLALRCWPEFAADFGIAPCAAISLLSSQGRLIACEGDIEGLLSMIAQRAVGGATPYLFDFSQFDMVEDYALLWHCGNAPCHLKDGANPCSLESYHAGGKGVTADFVLRQGAVSILRFDTAGCDTRLFLCRAEGMPMEKLLKGTYLKARFDQPVTALMQRLIDHGIAHHASMVYGDFLKPFAILAKIKGWQLISI